jgi:hypothetical protein
MPVLDRFSVCKEMLELLRASAIFGNAPVKLLHDRLRVIRFEHLRASRNLPNADSEYTMSFWLRSRD